MEEVRFGRLLRAARRLKRWTQYEAADEMGISRRELQRWEALAFSPNYHREEELRQQVYRWVIEVAQGLKQVRHVIPHD